MKMQRWGGEGGAEEVGGNRVAAQAATFGRHTYPSQGGISASAGAGGLEEGPLQMR